jgi:hypothetical protein
VPPPDGRTGLQALLARSAGGHAVAGEVVVSGSTDAASIQPGDFVEVDLTGADSARVAVDQLQRDLQEAGVHGVALTQLIAP